jgi:hypothetical protein
VIRQATFIPHPADNALHDDARGSRGARPTRREFAKQTRSNFLSRLGGLEPQVIEFTAVLGAPAASTVQKGAAWGVTIRLTRFVVGETLILSARMRILTSSCDREVEMTPPTQTAAATAEVDVRASA